MGKHPLRYPGYTKLERGKQRLHDLLEGRRMSCAGIDHKVLVLVADSWADNACARVAWIGEEPHLTDHILTPRGEPLKLNGDPLPEVTAAMRGRVVRFATTDGEQGDLLLYFTCGHELRITWQPDGLPKFAGLSVKTRLQPVVMGGELGLGF